MRNKIQRQRPCFSTCTPSICIQGELEEPGNGLNTWFISSIGQSRNPGIILSYTFLHGSSQNRIWQFKINRVPHLQSILLLQKCPSQVYLQYRIIFVIKRITWYNFVQSLFSHFFLTHVNLDLLILLYAFYKILYYLLFLDIYLGTKPS